MMSMFGCFKYDCPIRQMMPIVVELKNTEFSSSRYVCLPSITRAGTEYTVDIVRPIFYTSGEYTVSLVP